MKTAPLLSIGMIFKNEARCLERCLQSLEPLRQAIPCELVMADTGAEDGSREIAERYADEVFDFPWIDDFAAARNAVMDRCSGKWYLTIDCDEWLDEDISELTAFLNSAKKVNYGFVIQRNYHSPELEKSSNYNDFFAMRLARMSTGQRYIGTIHESWAYSEPLVRLGKTVLHHDGYVYFSEEDIKKKSQRNMALLREKLKTEPEDLRTLMQCIESSGTDADLVHYIRTAVGLVQQKRGWWQIYGALIMRYAVSFAQNHEMQELDEWIDYAQREFPDSVYTLIDVQTTAFRAAYDKKDWARAVIHGETYQKGIQRIRPGHLSKKTEEELCHSSLTYGTAVAKRTIQTGLANAYLENGQGKETMEILAKLEGAELSSGQANNAVLAFCGLHACTLLDISAALTAFYDQISEEKPNAQQQRARLATFNNVAAAAFTKAYQKEEQEKDGYHRPAYTAFRCLADKCEAGRAAAIMMTDDPAEMREWLLQVEDWQALPIEALEHALQAGIAFPPEEKPLPIEVMDGLAAKLTHNDNPARQMTLALPDDAEYPSLQSLFWAQSLVLAALRSFDWTLGKNTAPVSKFACPEKKKDDAESEKPEDTPETGLALIRRFAQVESTVLPLLYTPQALAEENAALLPPMHRWGLYCSLAFEALDADNPQEYLVLLRKGLAACPGQKEIVQFLLDRFREDAQPKASPELLVLAEQVRKILSAYDSTDPAVAALKASPAYQQVAWLIEETPGLPVQ